MTQFNFDADAIMARARKDAERDKIRKERKTRNAVPNPVEVNAPTKARTRKTEPRELPDPRAPQRYDSVGDRYVGKPRRVKLTRRPDTQAMGSNIRTRKVAPNPVSSVTVRATMRHNY